MPPYSGSQDHIVDMQTNPDHYIASKLDVELIVNKDRTIARQTITVPRTSQTTQCSSREEDWIQTRLLGEGSGGLVYLYQCDEGVSVKRRAVKAVKAPKGYDYKREIEAAMLFSLPKASYYLLTFIDYDMLTFPSIRRASSSRTAGSKCMGESILSNTH